MKEKKEKLPICPLMRWLIRRTLDGETPPDSAENRTRLGLLAGWVSVGLSLLLGTVKAVLGLWSGSVSLTADAVNNFTDVGSSLVIALGFHWSRKPEDEEHPFGHGRIETVATLVLAIALVLVGFEVGRNGIARLLDPQPLRETGLLTAAVAATVAVKLWMAVFARRLAKLSGSQVLEADAWNHIFDVAATLLVVVALVGARLGFPALDGWMALAVAAFILITGVKYAREAIDILLGAAPDEADVEAVGRAVRSVDGVRDVHEILIHQYGDAKMVSFHAEVDCYLSAAEAHEIAEATERAVEEQLHWRALAHVDPVDRSHPLYEPLREALALFVEKERALIDFHDLRVRGEGDGCRASFDLVTRAGVSPRRKEELFRRCAEYLAERFSDRIAEVEIGVEAIIDPSPMRRRRVCPFAPRKDGVAGSEKGGGKD